MPDVRTDIDRNAASLARLRALVDGLSVAALDAPLGGEWTVKVALGHLAFWDTRQRVVLRRYLDGMPLGDGAPAAPEDSDEVVNEALVPLALHLKARTIRSLVMEAAEAIDGALERADRDALERLAASSQEWVLRRWRHREEHLEQIQRAL